MIYVSLMQDSILSKHWPYSHHCYLLGDTEEELHKFAQAIGLKRSWFQGKSALPHYDLTFGKRATAVRCGAEEIDNKQLAIRIRERRSK